MNGLPATTTAAPASAPLITAEAAAKLFAKRITNGPGPFPPKVVKENAPVTNTGPGAIKQDTPKTFAEAFTRKEGNTNNVETLAPGEVKSDETVAKSDATRYFYTQNKFWGGPTLSYTIYAILAVFPVTGFLGLDHMYMRSPGTGLAKFAFNFFSLGMWYFYDLIQAVNDKEDIYNYGVSMPLYGPSGIGAGSFLNPDEEEAEKEAAGATNGAADATNGAAGATNGAAGATNGAAGATNGHKGATNGHKGGGEDEKKSEGTSGSAISFMLYSFATFFIPFGFEYLAAGDFKGFVGKFLLTFVGIGLIIGLLNIIKLISHPEEVLCQGTKRPLIPFIEMFFPDANFVKKGGDCPKTESSGGWFSGLFNNLIKRIPILREIYAVTAEVASKAGKGVTALKQGVPLVTGFASATTKLGGGSPQFEVSQKPLIQQLGGERTADGFSGTILTFTLALVFIGAAFLKGKDFVEAAANRTTAQRPAELGKFLWRKKNVDDLPPTAPEPGIL